MKKRHYILFLIISLSTVSFSQEHDFFDYYHWNPEKYKADRIYKCHVINKDYEKGKLINEYLQIIELYDTLGRITVEKEYYDSDTTDGWHIYYKYDSLSRIVESEYYWLDTKDWEKTKYYYDSQGKLNKYCELNKPDKESDYDLDNCFEIHRTKNKVRYVTNSNNDTINYFKIKGRKTYRYTESDSIDTEYRKGYFIMRKYPDRTYYYKRNKEGQIIKTISYDNNKTKVSETIFEYNDGFLFKITDYDQDMKMTYQENYKYFYREE